MASPTNLNELTAVLSVLQGGNGELTPWEAVFKKLIPELNIIEQEDTFGVFDHMYTYRVPAGTKYVKCAVNAKSASWDVDAFEFDMTFSQRQYLRHEDGNSVFKDNGYYMYVPQEFVDRVG